MSNLVLVESEKKKQIYQLLRSYGVHEKILIDNEAEDALLFALSENDIERVYVDEEGALMITYTGDMQ